MFASLTVSGCRGVVLPVTLTPCDPVTLVYPITFGNDAAADIDSGCGQAEAGESRGVRITNVTWQDSGQALVPSWAGVRAEPRDVILDRMHRLIQCDVCPGTSYTFRSFISQAEQRQVSPSNSSLERLVQALGMIPGNLFCTIAPH